MQKVQFTAMIPIALSAFVIAGCATQQNNKELENVKNQIGELRTTNDKLTKDLETAGHTIGDLKKKLVELVEDKNKDSGLYTTLTYKFKSWEPADYVEGKSKPGLRFGKT